MVTVSFHKPKANPHPTDNHCNFVKILSLTLDDFVAAFLSPFHGHQSLFFECFNRPQRIGYSFEHFFHIGEPLSRARSHTTKHTIPSCFSRILRHCSLDGKHDLKKSVTFLVSRMQIARESDISSLALLPRGGGESQGVGISSSTVSSYSHVFLSSSTTVTIIIISLPLCDFVSFSILLRRSKKMRQPSQRSRFRLALLPRFSLSPLRAEMILLSLLRTRAARKLQNAYERNASAR